MTTNTPIEQNRGRGCLGTALIVLITVVVTAGVTWWVMTTYLFPDRFEPVELSQAERTALDRKLDIFRGWTSAPASEEATAEGNDLEPEKYTEEDADRTVRLSERELNGMLAENPDLAERLVIDLSADLASGKLLIPLDPDFPLMGGRTLRISAGLEMSYANQRPIVILKGVSVMGVPIPGAWLGGLKNVDLVQEFGDAGFWKAFADGVDNIRIEDGELVIQLRE